MALTRVVNGKRVPIPADEEAQIQAEWAAGPDLDAERARAVLNRKDFCSALWKAGILPQDQAIMAARGEWPATFAAFTTGLSSEAATDAQIEWATSMTIRYVAPTLQALALAHSGDDQAQATATLDALFGIG